MSRTRPEMRRGVEAFHKYVTPCFLSLLYDDVFAPNCAILARGRGTGTDLGIPFRGRLRSGTQMEVLRVCIIYAFGVHGVRHLRACYVVSMRHTVRIWCAVYAFRCVHPSDSQVVCMPCTLFAQDVPPWLIDSGNSAACARRFVPNRHGVTTFSARP